MATKIINMEEVLTDYTVNKLSLYAIAKKQGCSQSAIRYRLIKTRVKLRNLKEAHNTRFLNMVERVRPYYDSLMLGDITMLEICVKLSLSPVTIRMAFIYLRGLDVKKTEVF